MLAGIRTDGAPYFPQNEMYHVVSSPEWLVVWIDAADKVIFGFRRDGSVYVGNADFIDTIKEVKAMLDSIGINNIDFEALTVFSSEENPEWLNVELNADGKVLSGTRRNGSHYIHNVESETLPKVFSEIDDVEERMEIKTDADGKILSYRRKDGTKVENSLEVEHLKLAGEAGNELVAELKKLGFSAETPVDWSDDEFGEIPIPSVCAVVNIETDKQAETKTSDIKTYIQYWDKGGNYFRKPIILNAQGSSSMNYWIKNQAIDLDDGSTIKFGNWVPQDSFHIKKYYIDVFRGQCIVGYWLTEQVYQTRPYGDKRPWDYLNQGATAENGIGKFKQDFDTGALAHPDVFPIKVTY